MVSVSNLEDIPSLDLYPTSSVPDYYRGNSPEVLRAEAVPSQPPDDTQMKKRKPETPLSPPRTPKTPPDNLHRLQRDPSIQSYDPDPGRYILQKIRKRPLSVSKIKYI